MVNSDQPNFILLLPPSPIFQMSLVDYYNQIIVCSVQIEKAVVVVVESFTFKPALLHLT